ncbi:dynamin-related protein 3B-like isoform X3 [Carya illinoinensis]|uniref:dynamin-related protein 3B-like isoform X3 n=1 Tax=Carya illinoinensis TaxID=32201 RepID=UPI001C728351|nr:dynamin-related protein 3B-like isoform X3 [Carya illinoinensis]
MGEETRPNGTNPRTSAPPTIGSSVIPIVNKLQDILAPVGSELSNISLPHVAVVGSQSSGKSSVLEALVGRDFLPRGRDICTRRPLILMLENFQPKPGDHNGEWGEFRHLPGQRFYDFSKIRQEIQTETEREAGYNKGVSDKQIGLKIFSPNVLNMTLVDLPGITKVPVGDQPSDIEARIRKMIMAHISQENCIILAVSPANSDLATSDALQMAREADPTGSRTIGVITKLDIMDRGTDARNFLLGKVVPLRLGYVGVVNRSQEDINKNRSIAEALAYEERFFRDHPVYCGLSDHCGIPQLASLLNQILEQHIRMVLPGLKADLNSHMGGIVKELRTYGDAMESKGEQGVILSNILTKYCEAFSAMVDGKSNKMSTKELSGGARIHYIFQSIFVKSLEEVDPCEDLNDDDIRTAVQNATGLGNTLFVPEVPFEVLVRRQIARLLDPSLQCLRFVYDELMKMSRACGAVELQRFPFLRRRMDEVMGKFLRDGVKPAERMIANLIEMEMDYINSSNPKFIGGSKAIELAKQQLKLSQDLDVEKVPTSERIQSSRKLVVNGVVYGISHSWQGEHLPSNIYTCNAGGNTASRTWGISSMFGSRAKSGEVQGSQSVGETVPFVEQIPSTIQLREPPSMLRPLEMTERDAEIIIATKLLLGSYYDIVRKNIQDLVPKSIMHFLVNHTKRDLHIVFIQKLYKENLFDELLQEHDEVVVKRKQNREMYNVLQQAIQTLEEVELVVSSHSSNLRPGTDATTGLSRIPDFSSHLRSTNYGENRSSDASSFTNSRASRLFHSEGAAVLPVNSNGL